jgi:hypothetical protein
MEVNQANQIKKLEVNRNNQIKQIEINHANQMTTMQNRLILMKMNQYSRPHHNPNDKWPKKPPLQEKIPPNPFESTNLVDHQVIPYCRPCGEFHEELTCQIFLEICGEEGSSKSEMNKLTCVVENIMLA